MSKPKHYWYGNVKRLIMSYDKLKEDHTLQATIMLHAIDDAKEETLRLPHGEERIRTIDAVLIKQTKTIDGMTIELHYEERTVRSWVQSFVNLVGRKAGY